MSSPDTETREIEGLDLLRAKLNRPRVTRDVVARPRLLERLNSGLDAHLILVCAPAGFGKTTLISSWLDSMAAAGGEGTAVPAAWLALDEHDSNLGLFLRYLVAALRTRFPDAASETLALLQAPEQLPMAELLTVLNNEIEDIPSPFVLVLDDYHHLDGQAVHEFLESLVRHQPRPLHLVLISRVDPPLSLASLRATDKIVEIRAADLRFNAEETAAYLDHVVERPLRQQERDLLQQLTEGWIAALRLAALSLRSTIDLEGLPPIVTRPGGSLSDYLQGEILEQQVPAIQMFLLRTSILDRFCVSLGEAVVGQVDRAWSVRACTDWLERADLLTASVDDHRTWYRYHALVRDFLQERLRASSGTEVVAELHRKAATWFEQEGLLPEAMRHALEAGDLDLAASLIKQSLRDVLNRQDRAMLEHWLSVLPEEFVQRRPWLLMAKVWALQPSWQLGLQLKIVSQVEALLEEGGGATLPAEELQLLRGQILLLQGQYAYLRNQPAHGVANCEEALALVPRDWTYVRGGVMLYWGVCMGAIGRAQAAERLLLEEYELLDDKTTAYALRILEALCFNYLKGGQLERLSRTAYVMLQQATRSGLVYLQGWARFFLGLVAYQWNDLDAAGVHFAELLGQRYLVQSLGAYQGMAGLALVCQARGEGSEAWQVADILHEFQVEQRGYEGDDARSLRAGLMLDQGNREGAFRWADAFTIPPPDAPLLWVEVPHMTRARILLARNRADDVRLALEILDELLDIAERTHNTHFKITILALRAQALDAKREAQEALVTLQEAVDLSRPGGFLRAFVDLGPRMKGLLGRLAEQSSEAEPIRRILAAFPGSGLAMTTGGTEAPTERGNGPTPGVPVPVEPLTARELEILMLLREPLWPKEIARRLDISYLTVKRHTINIYGKLGVNTRWDAVNRAVELGLLPAS